MNRIAENHEIVQSISTAESRVMQVLWSDEPLPAEKIIARLEQNGPAHPKTIKTLLNRLVKKGALGFEEKGRKYHYFTRVDEADFYRLKSKSFLDKYFNGELSPLISLFSQGGNISPEDAAELRKLVEKLEAEDE